MTVMGFHGVTMGFSTQFVRFGIRGLWVLGIWGALPEGFGCGASIVAMEV